MAYCKNQPNLFRCQQVTQLGFPILFIAVPLVYYPDLYAFTLLPKRLLIQIVLTIIALFWILDWHGNFSLSFRDTRFKLPISTYLLFSTIALSQSVNPVVGLVNLAHQLTFAFLFFLVLNNIKEKTIPSLIRISSGVGILVSTIGILEAQGIDTELLPISSGRPSATFGYRNFAASYLIMNIPLALALWIRSRDLKDLCLGTISTGTMIVFLVYTRSRGAWIGLAGSTLLVTFLVIYAKWRWKTTLNLPKFPFRLRPRVLASIPVLILSLFLSMSPVKISFHDSQAIDEKKIDFLEALTSVVNPGADRGRLLMWHHTLKIVSDNFLFGVGPGNWRYVYPRYDRGDMLTPNSAPERPHNEILWIASEIGLLGLGSYLWILYVAATTVVRILRNPKKPENRLFAIAFGTSLLAMLGHGLLSFPRELAETSFLFWTGLGILARLDASAIDPFKKLPKKSKILFLSNCLIPILLLLSAWITICQIFFDKHYLLAHQSYNKKDLQSTLQNSKIALKYGSFDPQVFFLQGQGYQGIGKVHQGINSYLKGLQHHPNSIQLLGALGTTHARLGNYDQAEHYYRQVLKILPDYYEMYNNIGGIFKKRGELKKSIEISRQVIEINPLYIDAYRNLAFAYLESNRIEEAIQTYQQALSIVPKDPILFYELGEAYFKKTKIDPDTLDLAKTAYKMFLKNWQGSQTFVEIAHKQISKIEYHLSRVSQ